MRAVTPCASARPEDHVAWARPIRVHSVPFLVGCAVFFLLNLLPLLVMGRPDSLGNNTDAIYHYLKILRLRGDLAPDTSFDLDLRLPTDERLYRVVSSLAGQGERRLITTLQVIWCAYSLVFVLGSYVLGASVGGSPWAGAFLAASGWGFALALGGHWGWDFSPIVPHDLAAAFVPWLVLAWLRIPTTAGIVGVCAAAGLLSQIYPTTFVHFVGVMLLAQLFAQPRRVVRVVGAGAVFALTVAPLILAWRQRPPFPPQFLPLFRERFSYLAPPSVSCAFREARLLLLQLGLTGGASFLLRGSVPPPRWGHVRAFGVAALMAPLVGWWSVRVPSLAPLFISRASMFVYPWLLLVQARALARSQAPWRRGIALAVCLVSLALRPNLAGPVREVVAGRPVREAIAAYQFQDSEPFRQMCLWLRRFTDPRDRLLTPPDDRYLFLRAYARRPVAGLVKDLAAVHTPTAPVWENWRFVVRIKEAFDRRDVDSVFVLARFAGCRAVVFPPEWPSPLQAVFSNEAGSVAFLDEPISSEGGH